MSYLAQTLFLFFEKSLSEIVQGMLTTFQKTLVIVHLCLAFTVLLWVLFDPFLGQHFRIRGDILLIENLRGDKELQEKVSVQDREILEQNNALWHNLEPEIRSRILAAENNLIAQIHAPFWQKAYTGFNQLLVKTPFFELVWIFFSLFIGILCLKGNEGAKRASFILPLIVMLYAVDQAQKGEKGAQNPYPTEKEIIEKYLKHPLSDDLLTQKQELLYGFDLYLIEKWAHEAPSATPTAFKKQVIKGAFAFNLAQVEQRVATGFQTPVRNEHSALLIIYFMWNFFLAIALIRNNSYSKCILPGKSL